MRRDQRDLKKVDGDRVSELFLSHAVDEFADDESDGNEDSYGYMLT